MCALEVCTAALHAAETKVLLPATPPVQSPNLLCDSAWRVKICDFNLSRLMEETGARSSSMGGMLNPRWLVSRCLNILGGALLGCACAHRARGRGSAPEAQRR